jgi:hypothetical protein
MSDMEDTTTTYMTSSLHDHFNGQPHQSFILNVNKDITTRFVEFLLPACSVRTITGVTDVHCSAYALKQQPGRINNCYRIGTFDLGPSKGPKGIDRCEFTVCWDIFHMPMSSGQIQLYEGANHAGHAITVSQATDNLGHLFSGSSFRMAPFTKVTLRDPVTTASWEISTSNRYGFCPNMSAWNDRIVKLQVCNLAQRAC